MKKIFIILMTFVLSCPSCLAAPILEAPFNDDGGWILPSSYETGDSVTMSADGQNSGLGSNCVNIVRESQSQQRDILLLKRFSEISDEAVFGIKVYCDTSVSRPIFYADKVDGNANRVIAQMQLDYSSSSYKIYDDGKNKALETMGDDTDKVYDVAIHVTFTDGVPSAKFYSNGQELIFDDMKDGVRSKDYSSIDQFRIAVPKSSGTPTGKQNLYFDDFKIYLPPTATHARIEGKAEVESELKAVFAYSDNGGGEKGEAVYEWYESDVEGELGTIIKGEVSSSYYPSSSQIGKYISYSVQPTNKTGVKGEKVYSAQTQAVKEAPLVKPIAKDAYIDGINEVGNEVNGNFTFESPIDAGRGNCEFKWYRCNNENGVGKTEIFQGSDKYVIQKADKGKYLFFEVIPVDNLGNIGSVSPLSMPFKVSLGKVVEDDFDDGTVSGWGIIQNSGYGSISSVTAPEGGTGKALLIDRSVSSDGGFSVAKTLSQPLEDTVIVKTKVYAKSSPARLSIYADGASGESVLPAAQILLNHDGRFVFNNGSTNVGFNPNVMYSAMQWYEIELVLNLNKEKAAYFINGERAIVPNTENTFRNKTDNISRIRFDIGTNVTSVYVDYIEVYSPKRPKAQNVKISGISEIGETLTVNYDFKNGENYGENNTEFKWYSSYLNDSGYEVIKGENKASLKITEDLEGKYIKCVVVPVDEHGIIGDETESDVVRIKATGIKIVNTFEYNDILPNEEFVSNVTVSNFEEDAQDVCAVLVIYDADNKVIGIDRQQTKLSSNITFRLSATPLQKGVQAKVIVWDLASKMNELCKPFCLK